MSVLFPEAPAKVSGNWLDRAINYVNPQAGLKRMAARGAGQLMAGYRAAYPTRTSTPYGSSQSLGGLPHLNLAAQRNMRDRARSLCENDILAKSIIERATENIVGPDGMMFQMESSDADYNKRAEFLMNNWFGIMDFYGESWVEHQRLACKGFLRDGDFGAALLARGQVQQVQSDYVSSPFGRPMAFMHDGVELDKYGRTAQYWILNYVDLKKRSWTPVKPKDFLFVKRKSLVDQIRGETVFAQSFDLHDNIDKLPKAITMAMFMAACVGLFIENHNPTVATSGLSASLSGPNAGEKLFQMEPGFVQMGQIGERITQIKPEQPGGDFSPNMRMFIRLAGLAAGMPLEYVLMDFSQVSGPTAKAMDNAAHCAFETIQRTLIDNYYTPMARWRLSKFVKQGLLPPIPDGLAHRWRPRPWPFQDQLKELQAAKLKIDSGLSTERDEILALGGHPDRIAEQRKIELQRSRDNGVPILHSTYVQEIGVKAPVSTQEDVGTTAPGLEAAGAAPIDSN